VEELFSVNWRNTVLELSAAVELWNEIHAVL
jgi:hypothetical protein